MSYKNPRVPSGLAACYSCSSSATSWSRMVGRQPGQAAQQAPLLPLHGRPGLHTWQRLSPGYEVGGRMHGGSRTTRCRPPASVQLQNSSLACSSQLACLLVFAARECELAMNCAGSLATSNSPRRPRSNYSILPSQTHAVGANLVANCERRLFDEDLLCSTTIGGRMSGGRGGAAEKARSKPMAFSGQHLRLTLNVRHHSV